MPMPIDLVFAQNPIEERAPDLARAFEDAVRRALVATPAGAAVPLHVRFNVWDAEEIRYVCKVEALAAPSLEATPAWRFWSGLVATPQELTEQIRDAVAARQAARPPVAEPARPAQDNWGWAELQTV
jgi:hypothetical protein